MAFNANAPQKTSFDTSVPDEGLHPARLARIIELGEQEDKYGKKEKVVLAYTLPGEMVEIDGEMKQRMMMTFPLTLTNNVDSTLMKHMKALNGATWEDVLGKPCMLEVVHKEVNGVIRANISNVVKPMAGMEIAMPDCDTYIFDFENPSKEVFDKLSEFRQNQIKSATNYAGSAVEAMLTGKAAPATTAAEDSPI